MVVWVRMVGGVVEGGLVVEVGLVVRGLVVVVWWYVVVWCGVVVWRVVVRRGVVRVVWCVVVMWGVVVWNIWCGSYHHHQGEGQYLKTERVITWLRSIPDLVPGLVFKNDHNLCVYMVEARLYSLNLMGYEPNFTILNCARLAPMSKVNISR